MARPQLSAQPEATTAEVKRAVMAKIFMVAEEVLFVVARRGNAHKRLSSWDLCCDVSSNST